MWMKSVCVLDQEKEKEEIHENWIKKKDWNDFVIIFVVFHCV